MTSLVTSSRGSVGKNLEVDLTLEVPLEQLGLCNSNPSISLELDGTELPISKQQRDILLGFTKTDIETGSSALPLTTGDQVP